MNRKEEEVINFIECATEGTELETLYYMWNGVGLGFAIAKDKFNCDISDELLKEIKSILKDIASRMD